MKFQGKTVLVTGGSSGIGKATAIAFAKEGAKVIIQARTESKLIDVVNEIKATSGEAFYEATDLTNPDAVKEAAQSISQKHGVPDIVINSAGLGEWLSMEESSIEHFKQTIESPYLATAYTCKSYLDLMKKRGTGHFITINSAAAYFNFKKAVGYISARWALRGFMEAFRADIRNTGIKASSVTFAKVDSPYFKNNPISEERIPNVANVLLTETTPDGAAKLVLKTAGNQRPVVFNSINLRVFAWMSQAFPGMFRWVLRVTS